MFREVKTGEKITNQTIKITFDPDKRITNTNSNNVKEVRIFDPDVRGCYWTVMVPAATTTED